jgi:hypothetical protein
MGVPDFIKEGFGHFLVIPVEFDRITPGETGV